MGKAHPTVRAQPMAKAVRQDHTSTHLEHTVAILLQQQPTQQLTDQH